VGDRIQAIGIGTSDAEIEPAGGGFEKWSQVAQTVACFPATCRKPSKLGTSTTTRVIAWDSKACTCSTRANLQPSAVSDQQSSGMLRATVVRDGVMVAIDIKDPKPTMTAGDKRVLAAGPRLTITPFLLGVFIVLMSLCVIGTHGLLSGTATMDFGGRKGAATAVGMIDGFVYLGTAFQSFALGSLTSKSWSYWPLFLLPFAAIGFLLSLRIWNAKPGPRAHS